MTLKIATHELRAFSIGGPVARQAVWLRLRDEEEGIEGVGEAAPIAGFSRETLGEVMHTLHGVLGAIDAIDDGSGAADAASPAAPVVAGVLAPHAAVLDGCPSARFALETALFDLLARRRGQDLATCVRGAPRALDEVEASALLRDADGADFVERAQAVLARGFRVLKVKLRAADDAALDHEIAGLATLRRAAPDVELRLDPNGRWSVEDARRRLARLTPLAPAFVEQPVAPHQLLALGPCAVPWAADESLAVAGVAERLSPEVGCAAFVLKPAALGLVRARELASLARARGLAPTLTHFFDGPIGLAAACETALSLDVAPLACGLDPHPGLRALPPSALPHHTAPARVHATGAAGLGVSFEPGAPARSTSRAARSAR